MQGDLHVRFFEGI